MFIYKLFILLSLTCLMSCEDKISDEQADNPLTTINPATEEKCDNSMNYAGIETVVDITDTTSRITWDADADSIGYILFKSVGGELEILKHFAASETSHNLIGLEAETNYKILMRTINANGRLDCNESFQEFSTTEKNTFNSCRDIHDYYLGVKPSGEYEIDTDLSGPNAAINVYCDMDNNDGGWTRVFTHNTVAGLFLNDAEALESNVLDIHQDKYSILSKLDEFKKAGKFEFWIYYPEIDGIDGGNIWTQTSNPTSDSISGYVALRETYNGRNWGGLEKSSYSGTLMDGSVGSGWWFYAIGASRYWPSAGTIPGPLGSTGMIEVQLYVR
jgi:hypothetical protein